MSSADYTDIPWEQGVEDKTIPKGQHELRVTSAEPSTSKGDPDKGTPQRRMVEVMLELEGGGDEDYAPIFHYLVFPNANETDVSADDKQKRAAKLMIRNVRRFLSSFGISEAEFKSGGHQTLLGKVGRCGITHEMYNGEPQPRLALPKLVA